MNAQSQPRGGNGQRQTHAWSITRATSYSDHYILSSVLAPYVYGCGDIYFVVGGDVAFKFMVDTTNNIITIWRGWKDFSKYYSTNNYDYTIHVAPRGYSIFDVTMTCPNQQPVLRNKTELMIQVVSDFQFEADLFSVKHNHAPTFEARIRAYPLYGLVIPLYSATRDRLALPAFFLEEFEEFDHIQVIDAESLEEYEIAIKAPMPDAGMLSIDQDWREFGSVNGLQPPTFIKLEADAPRVLAWINEW